MLNQLSFTGTSKIDKAIKLLRDLEPADGYYLAFSGGKDSCVIKALADMAGVKYDAHYNITTVDPPELVRFIKGEHKDVVMEKPKETMWKIIAEHRMPPTRRVRYCCEYLKEGGGTGRTVITGVRRAESNKRSKRQSVELITKSRTKRQEEANETIYKMNDNTTKRNFIESCPRKGKWVVNPIIDWSDGEVWEFLKSNKIPYCRLYDEGFKRLGCVGCPMAGERQRRFGFRKYPQYKKAYIKAFDEMIEGRITAGLPCDNWETGEDVFDWWISEKRVDKTIAEEQEKLKEVFDD